jgi:hypothetical protein
VCGIPKNGPSHKRHLGDTAVPLQFAADAHQATKRAIATFSRLVTRRGTGWQNVRVSHGDRKHAGSRKAPRTARPRKRIDPRVGVYAVGVTFCVVAWGYLVFAAIDFGGTAREGRGIAWLFLFVACIGAACCLFAGLMLGMRALIALGLVTRPADEDPAPSAPPAPRVPGGRRALR